MLFFLSLGILLRFRAAFAMMPATIKAPLAIFGDPSLAPMLYFPSCISTTQNAWPGHPPSGALAGQAASLHAAAHPTPQLAYGPFLFPEVYVPNVRGMPLSSVTSTKLTPMLGEPFLTMKWMWPVRLLPTQPASAISSPW